MHRDAAAQLARTYHAQDLQPEHPVRRAIDALNEAERRIAKLEDEAARMLRLARENGQLRDVARRERDEAQQLLRDAFAEIDSLCDFVGEGAMHLVGAPSAHRQARQVMSRIDTHLQIAEGGR